MVRDYDNSRLVFFDSLDLHSNGIFREDTSPRYKLCTEFEQWFRYTGGGNYAAERIMYLFENGINRKNGPIYGMI